MHKRISSLKTLSAVVLLGFSGLGQPSLAHQTSGKNSNSVMSQLSKSRVLKSDSVAQKRIEDNLGIGKKKSKLRLVKGKEGEELKGIAKEIHKRVIQSPYFDQCKVIPPPPKVYVFDSNELYAEALSFQHTGFPSPFKIATHGEATAVIISSGMLKKCTSEEIKFTFGHEFGHLMIIWNPEQFDSYKPPNENSVRVEWEKLKMANDSFLQNKYNVELLADKLGMIINHATEPAISLFTKFEKEPNKKLNPEHPRPSPGLRIEAAKKVAEEIARQKPGLFKPFPARGL